MRADRILALVVSISLAFNAQLACGQTAAIALPAGTKVYLVTDHEVSSARGESDVGTIVPCKIWKDVEEQGVLYIKAGTVAGCRVEKVSRRNMGGKEGKVSIGAIETKSVDGQGVLLQGGYNKEGSGHKAVVWTVGLLLLWPVLFVPGGNAKLPPGTVFDANTVNDLRVSTGSRATGNTPFLNLAGIANGFKAEIMLDEFVSQAKPEHLKIMLMADAPLPPAFVIDNVNGNPIEPLNLNLTEQTETNGSASAIGEVGIKALAKHFQKGINRFEISFTDGEGRKSQEVILDIQM